MTTSMFISRASRNVFVAAMSFDSPLRLNITSRLLCTCVVLIRILAAFTDQLPPPTS